MPKVYDCFAFFNELDLLDLRLKELDGAVDHFVIVEATRTFQKAPKPLYFHENRERYKQFADKIIHVVVDKYPNFFTNFKFRVPHTWDYDNSQKEFILEGIKNAAPDDVIIVSDLDEIPLKSKVLQYKDSEKTCVFEQYLCYYYVNNVCTQRSGAEQHMNKDGFGFWRGSVMTKKKNVKTIKKTRMMRDKNEPDVTVIPRGGWHLSFLGGTQEIVKKIEAWTHKEYNNEKYKNKEYLETVIREGKSLFDPLTTFKLFDVEKSGLEFPQPILNNKEAYKNLILEPGG